MSLTERLRDMERRIAALEQRAATGEQVQQALVDAVEAAAADEGDDTAADGSPTVTLDGEQVGGARDQSQPL